MRRHVQCDLRFHPRGGRRRNAGRKPSSPGRRVPHTRRADINPRFPIHITLRVVDDMPRLRRRHAFKAVRGVMLRTANRRNFRIVHLSIQSNHVHMICEAADRRALTSGIASFKISASRHLNKIANRSGAVFADRYHEEILTTPTQVRHCLNYVLNNWRRHREDRDAVTRVDPYSTGMWFTGWAEQTFTVPPDLDVLPSAPARTWFLREGWRCAGPPISLFAIPG